MIIYGHESTSSKLTLYRADLFRLHFLSLRGFVTQQHLRSGQIQVCKIVYYFEELGSRIHLPLAKNSWHKADLTDGRLKAKYYEANGLPLS